MIIQSGIVEVVYVSDKYSQDVHVLASKRMLTMAGVRSNALRTIAYICNRDDNDDDYGSYNTDDDVDCDNDDNGDVDDCDYDDGY